MTDLTTEARQGQGHGVNPFLWSSDSWLAFQAGRLLDKGADIVTASKGRGYSVKITLGSTDTVRFIFSGRKLDIVTVEENMFRPVHDPCQPFFYPQRTMNPIDTPVP
jgi:hypothetical protein